MPLPLAALVGGFFQQQGLDAGKQKLLGLGMAPWFKGSQRFPIFRSLRLGHQVIEPIEQFGKGGLALKARGILSQKAEKIDGPILAPLGLPACIPLVATAQSSANNAGNGNRRVAFRGLEGREI